MSLNNIKINIMNMINVHVTSSLLISMLVGGGNKWDNDLKRR